MSTAPDPDPLRELRDAVSSDDAARLHETLRRRGRALAVRGGASFRAALAGLDRGARDDVLLSSLLGVSFRGGEPDRIAATGYHEAAVAAVDADPTLPAFDVSSVLINAAAAARVRGALAEGDALLDRAATTLPPHERASMPERLELSARIAHERGIIRLHQGRFDEAGDELGTARGLADEYLTTQETVEGLGALSLIDYVRGRYDESLESVATARRLGRDPVTRPFLAAALCSEALVEVERDADRSLAALLAEATDAARGGEFEPFALLVSGQVAVIQGRSVEALDLLMEADQLYSGWRPKGIGRDLVLALRAAILITLGEGSAAMSILATVEPHERHAVCPERMRSRFALVAGDFDAAEKHLRECEAIGDQHSPRTLMDVLLTRAALEAGRGDWSRSDLAFDRALYRMASVGARSPLRGLPASITARLLERATRRPQPPAVLDFVASLDRHAIGPERPAEPLSNRERVVLELLERRLTVAAMAQELYVSPNTVKTHLQRLYRKLGVSARDEALQRARALGIRPEITPRSPEESVD